MPSGYKKQVNKGDRFGNFEIIKEVDKKHSKRRFLCKNIITGQERNVMLGHLTTGQSRGFDFKNCNPNTKHGMTGSRQYNTWMGIKARCLREKGQQNYKYYGGRGIKICDRWKDSFENFWEDMKSGYTDEMTIERINVNRDYEPSNCKWIKGVAQKYNRRSNVILTIYGIAKPLIEWADEYGIDRTVLYSRAISYKITDPKRLLSRDNISTQRREITYLGETKIVTEWCKIFELPYSTVIGRLRRGWTIEKSLTTPKLPSGRPVNELLTKERASNDK